MFNISKLASCAIEMYDSISFAFEVSVEFLYVSLEELVFLWINFCFLIFGLFCAAFCSAILFTGMFHFRHHLLFLMFIITGLSMSE